jgi:hypothetical protein
MPPLICLLITAQSTLKILINEKIREKKYIRMKTREEEKEFCYLYIYRRISKSGLELKNILRESIRAESLRGGKKKTRNRRGEGVGRGWVGGGATKLQNDIDTRVYEKIW